MFVYEQPRATCRRSHFRGWSSLYLVYENEDLVYEEEAPMITLLVYRRTRRFCRARWQEGFPCGGLVYDCRYIYPSLPEIEGD